jgi:hypothetical protein
MQMRSLLMASLVVGLSTTAFAADFDTIDVDQDGVITVEEAMPVGLFQDSFDNADMDSDGMIDPTEYSAFASEQDQGSDSDDMDYFE